MGKNLVKFSKDIVCAFPNDNIDGQYNTKTTDNFVKIDCIIVIIAYTLFS